MSIHFSSATDLWSTPQDFFDKINKEFGFELDVCATPDNAKCTQYFTKEDDGLSQEWKGICWMNPPYGREIKSWVRKAHEIRFIHGRLKFGNSKNSAPFPSAIVVMKN